MAADDLAAGRVDRGYLCNLRVIARAGSTGGFRVHRYLDRNGHECAYYDTTLLFPTNATSLSAEATAVAVLDMTDPAKPVRTATLVTPAMQSPHESVNISVERGLLAATSGNPTASPGTLDVYDIAHDCRNPVLLTTQPQAAFGHESGMAPDGLTFYPTSISTGETTAVDLADPSAPRRIWRGEFGTHGMSVSGDGTRGYHATLDGLTITDLSEVQARAPDPQVREVSRLAWSNGSIPQVAIPVTIRGRPYVVEVDEYSENAEGSIASHGERVGAARIIDVSDERRPFVVSNIRLEVHQPEHREAIAGDPGAQSPVQGYAAHYCDVPQRREPGIVACSMILSGLRVFDIRDPENPREIAYHVAPPSTVSATGSPYIDERANWAMSQPAFAPERGEIWYADGTSGFHALRMHPKVWPFRAARGAGCVQNEGFLSVGARPVGERVRLAFRRRARLPVRIDVARVASRRRVLRGRLVARFDRRTRSVTWNGAADRGRRRTAGAGHYVVRFTMLRRGRPYDVRRLVLARDARGRFRVRRSHQRRDGCGLLARFRLKRPVFGGATRAPLAGSYRVSARARVSLAISRGRKVVRRLGPVARTAGRTFRFSVPAARLPRGSYRIRLLVQSGDERAAAVVWARRL